MYMYIYIYVHIYIYKKYKFSPLHFSAVDSQITGGTPETCNDLKPNDSSYMYTG